MRSVLYSVQLLLCILTCQYVFSINIYKIEIKEIRIHIIIWFHHSFIYLKKVHSVTEIEAINVKLNKFFAQTTEKKSLEPIIPSDRINRKH